MLRLREVRRQNDECSFCWNDQTETRVSLKSLRERCACAVCRELREAGVVKHYNGEPALRSIDLIGNYALGVMWSDGHRSIYALDRLREIAA